MDFDLGFEHAQTREDHYWLQYESWVNVSTLNVPRCQFGAGTKQDLVLLPPGSSV